MKTILTTLLILGFAFSMAQTAFADFITPVGVIASGRMSDPEDMIDESGMRVFLCCFATNHVVTFHTASSATGNDPIVLCS